MVFCAYMTFIYMPFDIFIKPVAEDEEIWFGFALHGWWAKLTAPLHWLIYGLGFYGFLRMKPALWPWAGLYTLQVAIAMFVWNLVEEKGRGLVAGIVMATPFLVLAFYLLRDREIFAAGIYQTGTQEGETGD